MTTTLYPVILPVSDADRALVRGDRVRALSRHARQAVRLSCAMSGLRLDHFPKDAGGVPLPVDGVYWSLSHKHAVVGGVAAPLPVGIDLETVRPVKDGVMDRVAGPVEWQMAGGRSLDAFFRFWTAKEAVLKAVGIGFAGMSRCRVIDITGATRMLLVFDAQRWPVEHHWFGGHVAAITAREVTVSWTIHG
jgi:4'-phosphopantetheinyl transferase